jgi:very-short-patch-repair endonuclease
VELLRYYLQYAATNGKQLADAQATGVPLNAFEAEVFDVLQSKGMPLIPQVGASRFRIDLVAQHPREPGRFVLAIECDGASYHSSATARDRDRLRQQQLENLGWKFLRIWSTDWFMRKDEELERALAAYRAAVDEADHPRGNPHNSDPAPLRTTNPGDKANSSAGRRRGPRPSIPYRDSIGQYSDGELTTLVRWLNSDGHLRTDDELVSEMVRELGFTRRGTRIEASVREAIELLRSRNML